MVKSSPEHGRTNWAEAVSGIPQAKIDPTMPSDVRIETTTAVATVGTGFAQHLHSHLKARGFNHLVTEAGPSHLQEDELLDKNYGRNSARFGNIETSAQLLQLLERAYGRFTPSEDHWVEKDRFLDPFRPLVEPTGFESLDALLADRDRHLAAVRSMFAQMEVLVVSLHSTEILRNRADGAAYSVRSDLRVGAVDSKRYEFSNLGVEETTKQLSSFVDAIAGVNPTSKIILSVSPVPLAQTLTGKHVVQASTYSKSVLRIAAEQTCSIFPSVTYFPLYEIILGTTRTKVALAGDGRTVTPAGVERTMALFFKTYAGA